MRRKHKLTWLFCGIIILLSAAVMFLFRTQPVSYDEALSAVKNVSVLFDDQSEYMHQNPAFQDDRINDLNDLTELSNIIVLAEVKGVEQVNDFCFVTVDVEDYFREDGTREESMRILYPDHIIDNQYDRKGKHFEINEKVTISQNIPAVLKTNEKYVLFLNRISNHDLCELSTAFYSLIPVKDEIRILHKRKQPDVFKEIELNGSVLEYDYILITEADVLEKYTFIVNQCYKELLNRSIPKVLESE